MTKIYRDIDPITKETVYRQTHSDAVLFSDGKTLTEKMESGNDDTPSVVGDNVYVEDITSLIPAMWRNVNSDYSPDNYIIVNNDADNPQNAVVTVVKAQTQGRFGWFIARPLPVDIKIDVDVAYNGTGSTQGYYSNDYRTIGSYIEGTTINSSTTHLSFIVKNISYRHIGFSITGLKAGATITFSNFKASYYAPWQDYNKWVDIDYNTEKLLKVATNSTAKLALLHFSDIHGDVKAASYIRRFYDRNTANIDDMLCTGDIVEKQFSQDYEFYERNKLDEALFTLGNHDGASGPDGPWIGKERSEVYNRYMAKVANWGVVQPENAATDYLFYYYKDYTAAKVRLICLDGVHHGEWETVEGEYAAQLEWFQARLNEVLDSTNAAYGYKVVVASHYVPGTFEATNVVKNAAGNPVNFGSQTWALSSIMTYATFDNSYPEALNSFINAGGKFVVWLCGHYHTSGMAYLTNYPNILIHAIDQAGTVRTHGLYRERDTPTEIACSNVVIITDGLYRCIRVGYHQDGYLRSIKSMCYDWVNKKVISEQ